MTTSCPVCGEWFDVLYPDLWRYKRNHMHKKIVPVQLELPEKIRQ